MMAMSDHKWIPGQKVVEGPPMRRRCMTINRVTTTSMAVIGDKKFRVDGWQVTGGKARDCIVPLTLELERGKA